MPKSHLDNSIELTEDDWGLTLICAKGSNHAQIIIEKVDSSGYLMELAEFNGWGKARGVRAFKKLNPNNIKYDGKTKTWLLAKEKIEKLINSIEAEASLPIEKQPKFSIFGRNSFLAKPALAHVDTFLKSDMLSSAINRAAVASPYRYLYVGILLCYSTTRFGALLIHYGGNRDEESIYKRLKKTEDTLTFRYDREEAKNTKMDNCFTWAREKLILTGIPYQEFPEEFFVALTRRYTNPGEVPVQISTSTCCS